jgi:hypothetical protein
MCTGFVLGLRTGRSRGDCFDEVRGLEASRPRREYRSGSLRVWSSTIVRSVTEQDGGGGDVSVAGSYGDVGTATPIRMATLLRTFVFG